MEYIFLPASYKCIFHALRDLLGFDLTGIWGTCERHLQHAAQPGFFCRGSRGVTFTAPIRRPAWDGEVRSERAARPG